MTPVFITPLVKENKEIDLNFQGTLIPQGSTIILDTYSKSMDRSIVKNPQSFQPERWFANEVEAKIRDHFKEQEVDLIEETSKDKPLTDEPEAVKE
jgi:hypothetical protein